MLEASKAAQGGAEVSQQSTSNHLNGASDTNSGRQVGMKAKREDDDDGGIEWEEDVSTGR